MLQAVGSEAEAVRCFAEMQAAKPTTDRTEQAVPPPQPSAAIPKLRIPDHKRVFWNVVGAQPRIGCTTQAIALWHYCRALGFMPAVVMSPAELEVLAGYTGGIPSENGYRIQEIPFTTSTQGAFDCFIRDLGSPAELPAANATVLVAGCKPWELGNTVAALQRLPRQRLAAILSFSTSEAVRELLPLFGWIPVMASGYLPNPWNVPPPALSYYDRYLRPIAEQLCNESEEFTNAI